MKTLRKTAALFCVIMVLFVIMFAMAAADNEVFAADSGSCGDNVEWSFYQGTLTISGTGDMYDYPSSRPWPVNITIRNLIVEDGVTSIGKHCFASYDKLETVVLADSVESIGDMAFYRCTQIKDINMPRNLKYIGENAFLGDFLIPAADLPEGLETIGNSAFYGCSSLAEVTLPSTLTSIGEYAFYRCGDITEITIPSSVVSVGRNAFEECKSLSKVTISEGVKEISPYAFYNCELITEITIPSSVVSLGARMVDGCKNLTRITIAEGVKTIAGSAFSGCSSLSEVHIPSTMVSIGNNAFASCPNVAELYYNGNVVQWYKLITSSGTGNNAIINAGQWIFTSKANLADATVSLEKNSYIYTGSEIKPEPTVAFGDFTLPTSNAYTVEYKNNVKTGTATVTVTGIGTFFEGEKSTTFRIYVPASQLKVDLKESGYVYTGEPHKIPVTVSYKGNVLKEGTDYTIKYSNNVNAGTAKVTITGIEPYRGSVTKTYSIGQAANPIKIDKRSYSLIADPEKAQTIYIKASAPSGQIDFTPSKSSVKVSSAGKVTIPKKFTGTVTIDVCADDLDDNYEFTEAQVKITVTKGPVTKISLQKSLQIGVKAKTTLVPTRVYSCEVMTGLKWSSSNKKIAKVSKKGVVTAKKEGKAIITCTLKNGRKYKCKVRVRKNEFIDEKYNKVDFDESQYGDVKVAFLDAHYKGKKLIVNLALYNNRVFYAEKFKWIKFGVWYDDGVVQTIKMKNIPINLKGFGKKKITITIPMKKVYDLVGVGKDDFFVYSDDYYYIYSY